MDLDKIRKMNDEELSKLLKQLSARGGKACIKCNKPITFVINVKNDTTYQTKKLCGLCTDCYEDLLTYLGLYDVEWD